MRLYCLESPRDFHRREEQGSGRFLSEQGGYVYCQVSFAEVCDLISKRRSLESSEHQLGGDSGAFPISLGRCSTVTLHTFCRLHWSTNRLISLASLLDLRASVEQSVCLLSITALGPGEEGGQTTKL